MEVAAVSNVLHLPLQKFQEEVEKHAGGCFRRNALRTERLLRSLRYPRHQVGILLQGQSRAAASDLLPRCLHD